MKRLIYSLILSLLFMPISERAKATVIDINTYYFSETFSPPTGGNTVTRTAYDFGLGFDVKKNWLFMLNYTAYSATTTMGSTTDTYATGDMGFRFGYLSSRKTFITTLTYNLTSTGTYTPGSGSERALRGTSYKFDAGYNIWIGEASAISFRFAYFGTAYKEYVTGTTTLTNQSHTMASIYPSIGLFYLF